jgi:hypothetical protein
MPFCLPKNFSSELQKAIQTGKLNVADLMTAESSEARRNIIAKYVGEENAGTVNASFEKKVMLGTQKDALNKWLEKLSPEPKIKKQLADKIAKMEDLLSPEDLKAYMEDLVAEKLGAKISFEDTKKIVDLASDVNKAKEKVKPTEANGSKNRLEYGSKKEALRSFMSDMKEKMQKEESLSELFKEPGGTKKVIDSAQKEILNSSKTLSFSTDVSYGLNQGFKTMWIDPASFVKPFFEQFPEAIKGMGKDNTVLSGTYAEVFSRKNALNGIYDNPDIAKVVGGMEETYPKGKITKIVSKIPVVSQLLEGSEVSFTSAGMKMRANLVDKFVADGIKAGKNMFDPKELKAVASNVGAATRKGSFGTADVAVAKFSPWLSSPKAIKGDLDFIMNPLSMGKESTEFGLKTARINMLKVVAGRTAMVMALNAAYPGMVNLDPRSTDFLSVKIGTHKIKFDAGVIAAITLLSRFATGESVSSGGNVTELDTGEYGPNKTRMDLLKQFISNRISPGLQAELSALSGKDQFTGEDTSVSEQVMKAYTPLSVQNWKELGADPQSSSDDLFYQALDMMGAFTSDYQVK